MENRPGASGHRLDEELGNSASVDVCGRRVGGIGDAEEGGEGSVGGWGGRPGGDQEEQGADGHWPHLAFRLEFRGEGGGWDEARSDKPFEEVIEAGSAK